MKSVLIRMSGEYWESAIIAQIASTTFRLIVRLGLGFDWLLSIAKESRLIDGETSLLVLELTCGRVQHGGSVTLSKTQRVS